MPAWLQVLHQLPEGLANAVLVASPADLNHQLEILPATLHHLAIEAALPSIRRHHSLTLSFDSNASIRRRSAHAVLQAVIREGNVLKALNLSHIPVQGHKRLHQLIANACMSALNVSLSFTVDNAMQKGQTNALAQIGEALSCSSPLTGLSLAFMSDPGQIFDLDSLLQACTGLQSLTIEMEESIDSWLGSFPAPKCIIDMHLTHLCIGPGFHCIDLPKLARCMTQLRALHLRGGWEPKASELPSLSLLTALQTLELQDCWQLREIPSLESLTALQILHLGEFSQLQRIPSLSSLTALQELHLVACDMEQIPLLDTLTALQTLNLRSCLKLQELPLLDRLKALQTLQIIGCDFQRIPSLLSLTALQTLNLSCCKHLRELPSLDSLAALQTLELTDLGSEKLPSLSSLTALKTLKVTKNINLLELPPITSLTALQTLDLRECIQLQRIPPLESLTALRTLDVRNCVAELLELPLLADLPALQIVESSSPPESSSGGFQLFGDYGDYGEYGGFNYNRYDHFWEGYSQCSSS
jgi:Leucine-rich repeat (LRR) protein